MQERYQILNLKCFLKIFAFLSWNDSDVSHCSKVIIQGMFLISHFTTICLPDPIALSSSFLSHRRCISRNTNSTLFPMCSWRMLTGVYTQNSGTVFHAMSFWIVFESKWQQWQPWCSCSCSSQPEERCLWSGNPKSVEVSEILKSLSL